MPRTVVLTPPVAADEPVALDLLKEWVRIAPTDVTQDAVLSHLLKAAREKVEAYTGRYFASQTVQTTFELGEDYELDPLAGEPTDVTGYFTELSQLPPSLEEYRKGISVSRELPWDDAMRQTYTVTYPIEADADTVPGLAVQAVLELAAEWFRNRESSAVGTIAPELPVNWRVKLAELRRKPIAY